MLTDRHASRARKSAAVALALSVVASTLLVSPASVGANDDVQPIDFDYGDYYYETPEGYRTTDTDGDGIDPWGCEAYTYPYNPEPYWEVEPERSRPGRITDSLTAQVEANIAHAETQEGDCWYNEAERQLHAINYARAYSGVPALKPWFSNEHAEAAAQAQVDCSCSLRHWGEISQQFNDEFPGVTGVELISSGSGYSGLYSSLAHRFHFMDPNADYVSFALVDRYFVMIVITSDRRIPDYDQSGFLTWGDRYDSLEERNWVVGPEVGTGFRKADSNLSAWGAALRESVGAEWNAADRVWEPEIPYEIPTPLNVDETLNTVIHDPWDDPIITWQSPQVDTVNYEEDILHLVNDMRRTLADDDVNWPDLHPEPLERFAPSDTRPDPRTVEGGELDLGSAWYEYWKGPGDFEEGDLLAGFVPEWKRSEDFSVFNNQRTPLAHAGLALEIDQNYRTLLGSNSTYLEVSIECAYVDGIPNGSLRVFLTVIANPAQPNTDAIPRGHEIDGWGQYNFERNNISAETEQRLEDTYGNPSTATPCPAPPPPPVPPQYCNDLVVTVDLTREEQPTDGDDVILGTAGNDRIEALGGNDVICALGGDDVIFGGDGNDVIFAGEGGDYVVGGAGNDLLVGGAGSDLLNGGDGTNELQGDELDKKFVDGEIVPLIETIRDSSEPALSPIENAEVVHYCDGHEVTVDLAKDQKPTEGDDVIRGTAGNDQIHALGGNDVICGLGGNDVINGGDGKDLILGGAGDDIINAGQGLDIAYGQGGDDFIAGGKGKDTLIGGDGNDDLRGNEGTDTIDGGPGNDELRGGQKADVIFGGSGDDNLVGGTRPDVLDGGQGLDSYNGGGGTDVCAADPLGFTEVRLRCELS